MRKSFFPRRQYFWAPMHSCRIPRRRADLLAPGGAVSGYPVARRDTARVVGWLSDVAMSESESTHLGARPRPCAMRPTFYPL